LLGISEELLDSSEPLSEDNDEFVRLLLSDETRGSSPLPWHPVANRMVQTNKAFSTRLISLFILIALVY
jgi:hypothetical protein